MSCLLDITKRKGGFPSSLRQEVSEDFGSISSVTRVIGPFSGGPGILLRRDFGYRTTLTFKVVLK